MSRGDATMGHSKAESVRFLLRNNTNIPILTRGDNKKFNYNDQEFKDLKLTYCPIKAFDNYADVTCYESAFQIMFGFLPVGSHRLWKISGVGRSSLPLRKCDKKYIARTGDTNLRFMFGITVLHNVNVVDSHTDVNGVTTVKAITGGLGTKCRVNAGRRCLPIINQSQKTALARMHAMLPPHFISKAKMKRKADDVKDTEAKRQKK
jgi:hypothetical protein